MTSPSFQVDQPSGAGSGTAGQSRKDLWEDVELNLTCTNPPAGATFLWTLLYAPPGSTSVIANENASTAHITLDTVTQSYRLNLQINSGGPGLSFNFILCATKSSIGTTVNRGWRTPALDEQDGEPNFGGNANGYAPDYDQIIFDLLNNASFSGGGAGGYFKIDYSDSPYTLPNSGVTHLDIDTTALPQGNILVHLPPTPSLMQYLELKDLGAAAAYNISVDGNGNMIDSTSGYTIAMNWGNLNLRYNGTLWTIV